ncbi:MAG: tetratricopeptide repeat protein [Arenicellales bacterium]|nr:tetratricopeptide repeat protein [Arenicellales bacterium]
MNINPLALIKKLLWLPFLFAITVFGDQTDKRLDQLFITLQNNDDAVVQNETIHSIWEIWYESGREDIDRLMAEGEKAAQSGQLERAEQVFTSVIKNAPEFSEGWNRRATVRYYRNDYAGSLEDIQQTLELEPRHFGALWGKGMILAAQNNFTGAIRAFERMLKIAPYSEDTMRRIEALKKEMEEESI